MAPLVSNHALLNFQKKFKIFGSMTLTFIYFFLKKSSFFYDFYGEKIKNVYVGIQAPVQPKQRIKNNTDDETDHWLFQF